MNKYAPPVRRIADVQLECVISNWTSSYSRRTVALRASEIGGIHPAEITGPKFNVRRLRRVMEREGASQEWCRLTEAALYMPSHPGMGGVSIGASGALYFSHGKTLAQALICAATETNVEFVDAIYVSGSMLMQSESTTCLAGWTIRPDLGGRKAFLKEAEQSGLAHTQPFLARALKLYNIKTRSLCLYGNERDILRDVESFEDVKFHRVALEHALRMASGVDAGDKAHAAWGVRVAESELTRALHKTALRVYAREDYSVKNNDLESWARQ